MDIQQRWENFLARPFDIKTVSPICFALEQNDGAFLTEEKYQKLADACQNSKAIETKLMLMAVLSMFPLSFVKENEAKKNAAAPKKDEPVVEEEDEEEDGVGEENFMSIDEEESSDSDCISVTSSLKKTDNGGDAQKNTAISDITYEEIVASASVAAAKDFDAENHHAVFGKPTEEGPGPEPEKVKKPRKKTQKRMLPEFKEKNFVPRFIRAFYAVIGSGEKNKIKFSHFSKAIAHAVTNDVASPAERELWSMYNLIKWYDPEWKRDMGALFPKRLCFIPVEITPEITVQMEPIPGKETETKNGYKFLRVVDNAPALKKLKVSGENGDASEATHDLAHDRVEIRYLTKQQVDDLADEKKKFIVRFFRAFYEAQGVGIHTKEVLSSLAQKLDKKVKSNTANPQEMQLWQLFVEKQWFNKEINKSIFFMFPRELKAYSVWVTPSIHVYFETLKKGDGDNRPFRYLRVI